MNWEDKTWEDSQEIRMVPVEEILDYRSTDMFSPDGDARVRDTIPQKTEDIEKDETWQQLRPAVEDGTIDPVGVRYESVPGRTRLVNGHHRVALAVMQGVTHLPVTDADECDVWFQEHSDAWYNRHKTAAERLKDAIMAADR